MNETDVLEDLGTHDRVILK